MEHRLNLSLLSLYLFLSLSLSRFELAADYLSPGKRRVRAHGIKAVWSGWTQASRALVLNRQRIGWARRSRPMPKRTKSGQKRSNAVKARKHA